MVTKKTRMKNDGRTKDLTLHWLTKNYGQEWEIWRQLGQEWLINQDGGVDTKLQALSLFFNLYLTNSSYLSADVITFFVGKNGGQASLDEFKDTIFEKTKISYKIIILFCQDKLTKFSKLDILIKRRC